MIGLLTLAAIPTVTGVAEGVSQQRAQNAGKADEKRMSKFYLDASRETKSSRAREIHGKRVVLRDRKVKQIFQTPGPVEVFQMTDESSDRFISLHRLANLPIHCAHSI